MASLVEIEGIGLVPAEQLRAMGIATTEKLLAVCATAQGRQVTEAATGLSCELLLEWVNRADLFRIKGIGTQYSNLLEAAGVDSVPELAGRRADNLTKKMAEVNAEKKLVRQLPRQTQVAAWIEEAKVLPRTITY